MTDKENLEKLFHDHGFMDFHWIDPKDIVVAQWVRMKCLFGCKEMGKNACCPPHSPPIPECKRFFEEYHRAVVFHFSKAVEKPDDRFAWTRKISLRLLDLEREIFLSNYPKAFLFFLDSCCICKNCSGQPETCKEPMLARPTPESFGMDVYTTVRKIGYPIQVLKDTSEEMNRYAFMLID